MGSNSYVRIDDNIDHEFVFIKQLLASGNLLGFNLNGNIEGVMDGIPRYFYRSGFSLTFLIFYLFPPFVGYVIHHAIVHLVGFIGMWLLLDRYFIKRNNLLQLSISLCFGYLSYYHIQYGISVSGQPLLLYALLNLLNNKNKFYNWMIIISFPFFSFLPVTLPFFIPFLFVVFVFYYLHKRNVPKYFLLGILILSTINILVEFNLVYATLFSDIVSHRVERDMISLLDGGIPTSIKSFLVYCFENIRDTDNLAGVLYPIPIIMAFGWSVFKRQTDRYMILIFGFILFIILWGPISAYIIKFFDDKILLFRTFDIQRFDYMAPMLWLILLSLVLNKFEYNKIGEKAVSGVFLLVTFAGIGYRNIELKRNVSLLTNHTINFEINAGNLQEGHLNIFSFEPYEPQPTFKEFYDIQLFEQVKIFMDKRSLGKNYRTINLGIYPNILQYNGVKTLDSYQNNYPLSYKYKFKNIIENEIIKDINIENNFNMWGSKCYAFSAELGIEESAHTVSKHQHKKIHHLAYNWDAFKRMNGKYLISAIEIDEENNQRLKFLRYFESADSYWKIRIYEII